MSPSWRRDTVTAPHEDRGSASALAPRPAEEDSKSQTVMRRSFNEAAHKLGYWPVRPEPKREKAGLSPALREAADDERDVVAHASRTVLALGALGIVYGDIGTSPLYTEQVIFTAHRDAAHPTTAGVYGIASLIFWALTIVVSTKYAGFIMRAHNRGDGGIMALTALVHRRKVAHAAVLVTLGIFGAGLFFGDGMITPAISVISAVEGSEWWPPEPCASRRADRAGDPDRPVRRATVRYRRRGLAVRPGDPGLVRRHRDPRGPRGDRASVGA